MTGNIDTFDIGDRIAATATFTNDSDVATDPTTITFRVRTPAGTTTSYVYGTDAEVTKTSTGIYKFTKTVDAAGVWAVRAVGTGTVVAADEGLFVVDDGNF